MLALLLYSVVVAAFTGKAFGELSLETSSELVSKAVVGSPFNLTCSLTRSNSSIAWYYNNIPLCVQQQQQQQCLSQGTITDGGQILLFPNLTWSQAGWYTCAADGGTLGRKEIDFLLIVQVPPMIGVTFMGQIEYVTVEGYQVELPCSIMEGDPYPMITWIKMVGETEYSLPDKRYTVNQDTGSLIISNVSKSDFHNCSFQCRANNSVNEARSVSNMTVTVKDPNMPFISEFRLLTENQSALYYHQRQGDYQKLICTNITNQELKTYNLTVQWTKDFETLNHNNNTIDIHLIVNSSGFYCCIVCSNTTGLAMLTVCATLVVLRPESNESNFSRYVSLPAGQNRTANLLCQEATSLNPNAHLTFRWEYRNGSAPMKEGPLDLDCSDFNESLSYLQVKKLTSSQTVNFNCIGTRTVNKTSSIVRINAIAVTSVDICSSTNILNATEWTGEATSEEINSESVFVIKGNATYQQNIDITNGATRLFISGRLRQTSSEGIAIIRVILDGHKTFVLGNPSPKFAAWQWVSRTMVVDGFTNLTVQLAIGLQNESKISSVTAYFDDLCVNYSVLTLSDVEALVQALSVGIAVILLLIATLIVAFRVCCLHCRRKKKSDAILMSKVSVVVGRKWKGYKKKQLATYYNVFRQFRQENISVEDPSSNKNFFNMASPDSDIDGKDLDDKYCYSTTVAEDIKIIVNSSTKYLPKVPSVETSTPVMTEYYTFVDPKLLTTGSRTPIHSSNVSDSQVHVHRPQLSSSMQTAIAHSTSIECLKLENVPTTHTIRGSYSLNDIHKASEYISIVDSNPKISFLKQNETSSLHSEDSYDDIVAVTSDLKSSFHMKKFNHEQISRTSSLNSKDSYDDIVIINSEPKSSFHVKKHKQNSKESSLHGENIYDDTVVVTSDPKSSFHVKKFNREQSSIATSSLRSKDTYDDIVIINSGSFHTKKQNRTSSLHSESVYDDTVVISSDSKNMKNHGQDCKASSLHSENVYDDTVVVSDPKNSFHMKNQGQDCKANSLHSENVYDDTVVISSDPKK